MLAHCSKCGIFITRYWEPMDDPCQECGSDKFFITHLGLGYGDHPPTHQILMNVRTGEVLSDDPCNKEPG